MNSIELHNVSLDYPLDSEDAYSFKNALLNFYFKAKKPKVSVYKALDNISLSIKRGEKLGIIGLNGAGKTTLLKLISGIIPPSVGRVVTHGYLSTLLDFTTGFEDNLTGIENIIIRLMFLGLTRSQAQERVSSIIDFVELGEFIDRPLRTYSTGMVLKLALATSTAIKPEILVTDEVIGTADAVFMHKAHNRISEFLSQDCTLVMTSHSLDLIKQFCQRVIWLEKGKIIADGPVEEIIAAYQKQ
jgi:ABC-type polysaccharide/polyol phosphate transport system ATPase subunit